MSPAWFIPKLINDGTEISLRRGETNNVAAEASWSVIEFEYRDNFDDDTVPDICDCDDDNDGITDLIEQNGNVTRDTDGDGHYDHIDSDADNDGIPDNVEAQLTIGYLAPSGAVDSFTGLYTLYGSGLTPVDTDWDGIYDYVDLNSDNDNLNDIEENGMSDTLSGTDSDSDGLDNAFEGSVLNDFDPNDEINNPSVSILPDTDGDLALGGDLDYRDLFDVNPPASATLDFDGWDDYVDSDLNVSGYTQATFMAWVKLDPAFSNSGTVMDQDGFNIQITAAHLVRVQINSGSIILAITTALPVDEWVHITVSFNASLPSENLKVYVNGNLMKTSSHVSLQSPIFSSSELFNIGKNSYNYGNYFKGCIDEVRVFNVTLSEDQLRKIIYQEIAENLGSVAGIVVPKTIKDNATEQTIPWANLKGYYPMSDIISSGRTTDFSGNGHTATMHHITTIQEQTAPMPYQTSKDGDWTTVDNWLEGNVWNLDELSNSGYSIVKVSHDVSINSSIKTLGLLIDNNKTITVNGNNEINNSWYLGLDGTMDLQDDSQLVQGVESDLVTSASGKLLRRQKGSSNVYWYTYMSSPVGATGVSLLTDNNTAFNNTNNTAFKFNTLKEGNGSAVQFTTAYNEVGKLSTRWMYTFQNGITYYDWAHFSATTDLDPGVGYIHKGTGNAGLEQEYTFEGKPNNGTILIAADDVDGDSGNESQPDVTQTTTLIGNPYPSAIDAHKFIDDNVGVIDGTLYFWHQWAGSSHNLAEYEGGYALLNKLAKVRAYQFVGLSGADNGSQDGTLTPTQYIAVGQSFMTEVVADGNIEFNNSQRIFKREGIGETEFFRTTENTSVYEGEDPIQVIKLEFSASNDLSREIVLGFSDFTTTGFDYSYDGRMFADKQEDIYSMFEEYKMVTQAYPMYNVNTEIPIGLNTSGTHTYTIKAIDFIDFTEGQEVYLRDNYYNTYFDLRTDQSYSFTSEAGQFSDRFDIVFRTADTLGDDEFDVNRTLIYFNIDSDKLFVKGLNTTAKKLTLTNTLGQNILSFTNVSTQRLEDGLPLTNFSSGIYMVRLTTATNKIIDKKIIID